MSVWKVATMTGIDVRWYDQAQRVLFWAYYKGWTLGDYKAATRTAIDMMNSVQHPVYIIADLTRSDGVPSGIISAIRSSYCDIPDHYRGSVLFGATALGRTIINIANNLPVTKDKLYAVADLNAALDHLQQLGVDVRAVA